MSEQQLPKLKLCKDCKHVDPTGCHAFPEKWKCNAPQNMTTTISLLDGLPIRRMETASSCRCFGDSYCGPEGLWYEYEAPILYEMFRPVEKFSGSGNKKLEIGKDI